MSLPSVERVVLRAAVGHENYEDIEAMADILDRLEARGALGPVGTARVLAAIADALVVVAVARELGSDLSTWLAENDTLAPEDPNT